MEWLIAGIGATIAGTGGLISYILDNNEAIDQINYEQDELEKQYRQAKKNENDTYEQNKKDIELAYSQQKEKDSLSYEQDMAAYEKTLQQTNEKLNADFSAEKTEARHNAQVSDEAETFKEWNYSQVLNSQLGLLQNKELTDTLSYNNAAVSLGKSKGESLAAAASNGTRTSSINQAIDLEAAYNSMQLQSEQDSERLNNAANYKSLLLQNAQNNFGIQQTRNANNYTRGMYEEGGTKYGLWQTNLGIAQDTYNFNTAQRSQQYDLTKSQLEASYSNKKNALETEHANNLASLANNYNYNSGKLEMQYEDKTDPWKNFLRGGTALLGSGNSGWNTGWTVSNNAKDYFSK